MLGLWLLPSKTSQLVLQGTRKQARSPQRGEGAPGPPQGHLCVVTTFLGKLGSDSEVQEVAGGPMT